MKNRIIYLDILKGFLILTVVLGHIIKGDSILDIMIYTFHMPLFFLISGMFTKVNADTNIIEYIKKKAKVLIIPYITFSIIDVVVNIFIIGGLTGDIKSEIVGIVIGRGVGPEWFLFALFIADITYSLLVKYIRNKKIIISVSILLCTFGLYANILIDNLMFNYFYMIAIYRGFIALGFFVIGALGGEYIKRVNVNILCSLSILVVGLSLGLFNGQVSLFSLVFKNRLIYMTSSIISSLALILIFKKIFKNRNKVIEYLGVNSLIIMGTHQVIIKLINVITQVERYSYINSIFIFTIVVALEIPIIYLINNYCAFLIGKPKKIQKLEIGLA